VKASFLCPLYSSAGRRVMATRRMPPHARIRARAHFRLARFEFRVLLQARKVVQSRAWRESRKRQREAEASTGRMVHEPIGTLLEKKIPHVYIA
jgi:hypothetical protein